MLRPMTPVPMNAIESGADMLLGVNGVENAPRMQVARPPPRDTFFRYRKVPREFRIHLELPLVKAAKSIFVVAPHFLFLTP